MASMETAEAATHSYIHLNVGGTHYTTSLSTLTRYTESMLAVMFNQEDIPLARDEAGRYIIDRDGATFRYVLNFLRGGNLNLPPTFTDYYQLKEEVDFYQLDDMKELLELWRTLHWKDIETDEIKDTLITCNKSFRKKIRNTDISYERNGFHQLYRRSSSAYCRLFSTSFNNEDLTHPNPNTAFENDLVIFRYMFNFLTGKGNYMPNNKEELNKLREAADIYGMGELREVLNDKTTHFPGLKATTKL